VGRQGSFRCRFGRSSSQFGRSRRAIEVARRVAEPAVVAREDRRLGPATAGAPLKELFANLHRAYPDLQVTIENLITEGDKLEKFATGGASIALCEEA